MTHPVGRDLSLSWRGRDDQQVLEEVRRIATSATVPGIKVAGATSEVREDFETDGPAVVVVLALADPLSGQETWDVDALQQLLDDIRRRVNEAAIPYDLVLLVTSATPEASGDDDPDMPGSDQVTGT